MVLSFLWFNVGVVETNCDTYKCNPDSINQDPDSTNYILSCELTESCQIEKTFKRLK